MSSFNWSFLEQASSKAVNLIVQIVLARILAPEEFGILAILLVIVNIADVIAQSGLGLALIQETDSDDLSYTTAFWLNLGISVVLYVAILGLAPIFQSFYGIDQLDVYLRVIAIVVIVNAFNAIQRSYLQRRMDFKSLFAASTIGVFGSGILGVVAALIGWGIWALVIQTIAQSLLICAVMLIVVPWKPKFHFSKENGKSLFSYGWKLAITGLLNSLYTGISELIIGRVCSPSALGFYSQGRKYPNAAIAVIGNALQNVMFPALSLAKNDREQFLQRFTMFLQMGTFIVTPFSVLLAIVAEPVVALLLTEKWLPCVFIFQATCLTCAVLILQIANLRAYMALGDSGLYFKLNVIKCGLGVIVLSATAIVTRDINAVAAVWLLFSVLAVLLVDMIPAKRKFGYGCMRQIKDVVPTYVLCAIAALPSGLLSLLALDYIPLLCLQIVVFVLVYVGIAFLFRYKVLYQCIDALIKR